MARPMEEVPQSTEMSVYSGREGQFYPEIWPCRKPNVHLSGNNSQRNLKFAIEKSSLPGRRKSVPHVNCVLLGTMDTKKRTLRIFIVSFPWNVPLRAADPHIYVSLTPSRGCWAPRNNSLVKGVPRT